VHRGYGFGAGKATGAQVGNACVDAFELFLCCVITAEPSRAASASCS